MKKHHFSFRVDSVTESIEGIPESFEDIPGERFPKIVSNFEEHLDKEFSADKHTVTLLSYEFK